MADEVTFHDDSAPDEGDFIRVRRGGIPFGKIYHAAGFYRFYDSEPATRRGLRLEARDLEALKAVIRSRYP